MAKHKENKPSEIKEVKEPVKPAFVPKVKAVTFSDMLGIVQKESAGELDSSVIVKKVFERAYTLYEVVATLERKGEIYFICKI